jgi:hypothetical protein
MEEQKVNIEVAKLAKEKGFNIPTISYYTPEGYCTESEGYQTERLEESNWNDGQGSYPTSPEEVDCSAPTQSLLQKWLREVHKSVITIRVYNNGEEWDETEYRVSVSEFKHFTTHDSFVKSNFSTYEEALEVGLQEALKLIEIVKEK